MSNLSTLATRLQTKIAGAKEQNLVVADQELVELMDVQLDAVSAAHGSAHGSGHLSGHASTGKSFDEVQGME